MAIPSTAASSGTNIDVAGIVGKLMDVEKRPLTALTTKEGSAQAKISAFGQVKGALSAFQNSLLGLNNASKFQANTATSSDTSVFTATAMNSAAVGSHSIDVINLAQSQRLATQGLSSQTASIGNGTITFDFGKVNNGQFVANQGKYRANVINDATISNATVAAKEGATVLATDAVTFAPVANASGSIPSGTLTINGKEVGKINLLDSDSPVNRAINIAEALDDAYVASGGNAETITADNGKITIKADSGGKAITFSIAGEAKDSAEAAKNLATLMKQTGLTATQLGTQAYGNSSVTVASTAGLSVGDSIEGGGLPTGTVITEILDTTHFLTSAPVTDGADKSGVTLKLSTVSSTRTVAIDGTNNSMQGIRDAINAAKIGVSASIVNDGGAKPNRLVLTSDEIGAANNLNISVSGDAALSDLLTHDAAGTQKLSEIVAGKDASLVIDGIPVSKTTNIINDAVPGVTLNLLAAGSKNTLKIGRDTESVKTSVEGFVKTYNDLKKTIKDLTAYNEATKKGATLQGDSAMRSLERELDSMLATPLGTPAGSYTSLSQIGISKQTDGSLAIDSGKFGKAMEEKFNDVAGLFASIGKTTDPLVSYKNISEKTIPGNYAISVMQHATQGTMTGNKSVALGLTGIDAGTSINATVDGKTASVALTAGTYSSAELATMMQDAINNSSVFASAGKSVAASIDANGYLRIKSNSYGSSSSFGMDDGAGTLVADFMGANANKSSGQDVMGTINGETATGQGQLLTSSSGPSDGLQVQISGGALGTRGSVNYTQGYAYKLTDFVNKALGNTGILTGRLNGLSTTVRGISKERDQINARLSSVEERYRRQYTKLDATLSNMGKTSSYLSQQLSKM
ncbi:MAG: flagellar filament capping protein FliD [Gallionellaceae bacterium]